MMYPGLKESPRFYECEFRNGSMQLWRLFRWWCGVFEGQGLRTFYFLLVCTCLPTAIIVFSFACDHCQGHVGLPRSGQYDYQETRQQPHVGDEADQDDLNRGALYVSI
ncbi:unnamed protein product [Ranitomeya imitator]|uniref:Uncharacterized protein n=1 Tax=Ranitomeya imitator TaxID=111125 RepID=A0ABN9LB71_9NEOB|nr:unnamed protein product [Ranitomeya imitator]